MSNKYIFQNDKRLNYDIQEFGCFFRSCLFIAEKRTEKIVSPECIEMLWLKAINNDWIIDDNLKRADLLIESSIRVLSNKDVDVHEVGLFKYGVTEYYPWVLTYPKYQKYNYLIQRVRTKNGHDHYRVVDAFGNVLFDPYYPSPELDFVYYSILFYVG